MIVLLGIIASLIFLLYSLYCYQIIKGEPDKMDREIIGALADWIIVKGEAAKSYLWGMYAGSWLAEFLYFYLTLTLISNPTMRILTLMVILVEIYHLGRFGLNLHGFFTGKYLLREVFIWRLERLSALLFFTHSLLVLITLLFLR